MENRKRRVAPLEHLVHPEGHVTISMGKGINLFILKMNGVISKI
jgi:hypothetical protein